MMPDPITLADHVAAQNDRWIAVAAVCCLIAFGIFIWRWMVADRKNIADRLNHMTDQQIEMAINLSKVVANNTAALEDVSRIIERCPAAGLPQLRKMAQDENEARKNR